jgi:hypothetical protein
MKIKVMPEGASSGDISVNPGDCQYIITLDEAMQTRDDLTNAIGKVMVRKRKSVCDSCCMGVARHLFDSCTSNKKPRKLCDECTSKLIDSIPGVEVALNMRRIEEGDK